MSKHALIIDPNHERFLIYKDLLRSEGIDVEWVQNGRRACEYLRAHEDVRLVITELSLAGVDGFQVLKCLKTTANAGVPVLVISAFREMRKNACEMRAELGISSVLTTSTPADALRRMFQRLLRREEVETCAPAWEPTAVTDDARLASIERSGVRDHRPVSDAELQRIVERVAREMGTPTALVSLVLEDKQWFKARVGMASAETSLDVSFCRHVVDARAPLVVPDATVHPTFSQNALVVDGVVRGYAGAPLVSSDGEVWGSLCVIDADAPLALSEGDVEKLTQLAKMVVAEIERAPSAIEAEITARYGRFSERARAIFAKSNH